MRTFLTVTCLLIASPAFAYSQHCALPSPAPMENSSFQQAATQTKANTVASSSPFGKDALPPGIANMAFVKRVSSAGATMFDLGMVHGLHMAAARHGDDYRVFSVLPDGNAAIEGAPIDLSAPQLSTIASGNLISLGRNAGFDGYFVRSGKSIQVFYATPDGQALVPGILRDADGRDLTRSQVSDIPGAMPTVEVMAQGSAAPTTPASGSALVNSAPSVSGDMLGAVQKAYYGSIGPVSAPQIFMLIDPQCIYSIRSYQQLRGYAQAGKIRLSIVPLSVLDYEDHGQSTRSALALLSKPTDQIVPAWQAGDVGGPPAPDAQGRLEQNMAISEAIGVKGTPTFVWKKSDGSIGRIDGVPDDIMALLASVGS